MIPDQNPAVDQKQEYKVLFAADYTSLEEQLAKYSKQGYTVSHFQALHTSGYKTTFYCLMYR
jgi:hypothetical protein